MLSLARMMGYLRHRCSFGRWWCSAGGIATVSGPCLAAAGQKAIAACFNIALKTFIVNTSLRRRDGTADARQKPASLEHKNLQKIQRQCIFEPGSGQLVTPAATEGPAMRLTNFSDYALRILMYAAAPGRPLDRHCRLMTVFAIAPPGLSGASQSPSRGLGRACGGLRDPRAAGLLPQWASRRRFRNGCLRIRLPRCALSLRGT